MKRGGIHIVKPGGGCERQQEPNRWETLASTADQPMIPYNTSSIVEILKGVGYGLLVTDFMAALFTSP